MGAPVLHLVPVTALKPLFNGSGRTATRGLVEAGRSFGAILQQTLSVKDAKKIDLKSIDPQILAMLQSGTPLTTIVNQISKTLAGKVATALSHGTQSTISAVARNKLVQAFASALAPPGGSPPGSTAEQASTLAQRLQQLVANIAGVAAANAGQQNRIPGQILDANSAKEIPAQQQSEPPVSMDTMVASFIESVLRDAAAQLQASASGTAATTTQTTQTAPSTHAAPPTTQPPALPVTVASAAPSTHTPPSAPGSVLGRMLARAVLADARINAAPTLPVTVTPNAAATPKPIATATAAAIANATTQAPAPAAKTVASIPQAAASVSSPQNAPQPAVDTRASLANLVASIVDAARNSNGGSAGQNNTAFGWNLAQNALSHLTNGKATPIASDGSSFATQANALLGSWTTQNAGGSQATSLPQTLAPYTTVDANSVIDQVVKGMVVHNLGADTSNVRMRLSPENLGDVSVRLNVSGGNISATITAQSAEVRDTLLANQSQLSKSLADAGLKLSNFSVNVSSGGPNSFAQQQQLAQQAGVRRIAFHLGNSDETHDDVLSATPTFGPPLAAIGNVGLLNYLA